MTDAQLTARTRDLVARDLAHLWHPFTAHSAWASDDPLVIDRAEGMYLWDSDGRRYLDGVSSLWVTVHGHRVPEIDAAVRAQLDRLDHSTFLGLTHEPGIVLAEALLAGAPAGLTRVFYAGDGAAAVEAALKMAYQSKAQRGQQRPLYVHVAEGYHGDTLGAVSVGGMELFHETYRPIMLESRMVSCPGLVAAGQPRAERAAAVLAELASLLEREGDRVCAVIVEPLVQAAAGMLTHDGAFLVGVRELCDRHDVLMIVDEVATGVGRTGRMWAVDHVGVAPDLLVCGKGITGGYLPLSAVLATEAVYEAFLGPPSAGRTFFHGHTYTANPLCCAAAIANLGLLVERGTVAHAARVGERIGELTAGLATYDGVTEIRRLGTMTGIEVASVTDRTGMAVCRKARELGVILRPLGDVVVLMPPLAIDDAQLDELVQVADAAIRAVVQ
ncbi:MAG: adenosylmethionine--8-amino-7-oxononanoate transaminase [Actinomycetota bacterium]|nr:MAG: adenosylmethionine--8-amino-7-oxononanoate transaminase [Actinomycetota bacterium]